MVLITIDAAGRNVYGSGRLSTRDFWGQSIAVALQRVANDTGPTPIAQFVLYRRDGAGQWQKAIETANVTIPANASYRTLTNVAVFPDQPLPTDEAFMVAIRAVQGRFVVSTESPPTYATAILSETISGSLPNTLIPTTQEAPSDETYANFEIRGSVNEDGSTTATAPAANISTAAIPTFTVTLNDNDVLNDDSRDYLTAIGVHVVGSTSRGDVNQNDVRYGPQNLALPNNVRGDKTGSVIPDLQLAPGVYYYRLIGLDYFGVGSWTGWRKITILPGGVVTATGFAAPLTQLSNVDFPLNYKHAQSLAATKVQLELYEGPNLTRRSKEMTVNWTPAPQSGVGSDATRLVTWAMLTAAGLDTNAAWAALKWNTAYSYKIIITDSAGAKTTSTLRSFRTDGAPAVPAPLTLKDGSLITGRPEFRAIAPDVDTLPSNVTVTLEVSSDAGAVLFTVPMPWVPETTNAQGVKSGGYYLFQPSTAQIPTPGAGQTVYYRYRLSAFDGTLYSGEKTLAADRVWSASQRFAYKQGPIVAIDSPANGATITTGNPNIVISWVGGPATHVNFTFKDIATSAAGGWGFSPAQGGPYTSPMTINHPGSELYDNHSYEYTGHVTVGGVEGHSAPITVLLDYPAQPPPANFRAVPYTPSGAAFPALIQFSWNQTLFAQSNWARYVITETPFGGLDNGPETRIIADINLLTRTTIYYAPRSGLQNDYRLRQLIRVGNDWFLSTASLQSLRLDLKGPVFSRADNPLDCLTVVGDHPITMKGNATEDVIVPVAAEKPTSWETMTHYLTGSGTLRLVDDDSGDPLRPRQKRDRFLELIDDTIAVRTTDGDLWYVRVPFDSVSFVPRPGIGYDLPFNLRETDFTVLPIGAEIEQEVVAF